MLEGHSVYPLPAVSQRTDSLLALTELLGRTAGRFLVANLVTVSARYAKEVSRAVEGWALITEHANQKLAPLNFDISQHPEYMPLHAAYGGAHFPSISVNIRELLICFGGTDPKNSCGLVLELLRQGFERGELPRELRVIVVLGPLFEHGTVIRAMPATYPVELTVTGPVTPEKLAGLAAQADLAITTGGGTMYEFCALGLPSIVVPVLDKMAVNAKVLEEKGAVLRTARADRLSAQELIEACRRLLDGQARDTMAQAAQAAVDGQGAERIAIRLTKEWRLV